MASALIQFLVTELTTISSQCQRKNPELKKTIDNSLKIYEELKISENPLQDMKSKIELLEPLVMAAMTDNVKYISSAINCIHKMITYETIPETIGGLNGVFEILEVAAKCEQEEVQLKSLQSIVPLYTHYHHLIREASLIRMFMTAFKLHESQFPTVSNTATAIIRQLLIYIFDKSMEYTGSEVVKVDIDDKELNFNIYEADGFAVFRDICLLTTASNPVSLKITNWSNVLGLELIESIVAFHSQVFRKNPAFLKLLIQISDFALEKLENSSFDESCRIWRIVIVLFKEFRNLMMPSLKGFVIFGSKCLGQSELWQKALVLESFKDITADFDGLLEFFGEAQEELSSLFYAIYNVPIIDDEFKETKPFCLHQFTRNTPPYIPPNYPFLLSITISSQVQSAFIASNREEKVEFSRAIFNSQLSQRYISLFFKPEIFKSSILFDFAVIQAETHNSELLGHFFDALFKTDSFENFAIILRVAERDGNLLGAGWKWPVLVLHEYEVASLLKTREISGDVASQLMDLTQNIIESTKNLNGENLRSIICAFRELSIELGDSKQTVSLLPIRRLKQIALLNLFHYSIDDSLDPLLEHLLIKINSEDPVIRGQIGEALSLIVNQIISTLKEFNDNVQDRLLAVIDRTVAIQYLDVQRLGLESLHKLLQTQGPQLTVGWKMVFRILSKTQLVKNAFTSVKTISSDYLSNLEADNLENFVSILKLYATQTSELNISLTAVGQLWDVSDYLKTKDQFDLWIVLLESLLELSYDERSEVRTSAVQTLTRAIESFVTAKPLDSQSWDIVFDRVLIKLMERSKSALDDNSLMLMLQGVGQIFCQFGRQFSVSKSFDLYWTKLLDCVDHFCKSGRKDLVRVGIAVLHEITPLNKGTEAWNTWLRIGELIGIDESGLFSQESLFLYLNSIGLSPNFDLAFNVVDKALLYKYSEDYCRDLEYPSILQQTALERAEEHLDNFSCLRVFCRWLGFFAEHKVKLARVPSFRSLTQQPDQEEEVQSKPTKYPSFLALSNLLIVKIIPAHLATIKETFEPETMSLLIKALGRIMKGKYNFPMWKNATKLFMSISSQFELGQNVSLFVDVVGDYCSSSSQIIPSDISLTQLEEDENFDCEFIQKFLIVIIKKISDSRSIQRILEIISQSSRLFNNQRTSEDLGPSLNQGMYVVAVPVVKEKFAITAFQSLFELVNNSNDQISRLSLEILFEKCQNSLNSYINDKTIYGNTPFPVIRIDEVKFILKSLLTLNQPKCLHLIKLYPTFCNLMFDEDKEIISLLNKCFVRLGTLFEEKL